MAIDKTDPNPNLPRSRLYAAGPQETFLRTTSANIAIFDSVVVKAKRGRPPTGKAKTAVERMNAMRAKKAKQGL